MIPLYLDGLQLVSKLSYLEIAKLLFTCLLDTQYTYEFLEKKTERGCHRVYKGVGYLNNSKLNDCKNLPADSIRSANFPMRTSELSNCVAAFGSGRVNWQQ